jgi:hypothetical protein
VRTLCIASSDWFITSNRADPLLVVVEVCLAFVVASRDTHAAQAFGSGWRDLNPRPSVPQTDALTKLRHSP